MRYELELIKEKTSLMLNAIENQRKVDYIVIKETVIDITKLVDACILTINEIDANLTTLCLTTRRVTTDIK